MIVCKAEHFGAAIRRLRIEKEYSQDVLSGLAGIARSHLSAIETGKKMPNMDTLCHIADALEITPSELMKQVEADVQG